MEYRFGRGRSAPRDLCSGAFDARGFNPLPKEAPGGRRKMRFLRTARAISAHACRACLLSPPGFRPDVSGSPSGSVAKAAQRPRPALPARSPPPLVRSPAERPPPRRGEEKYAGGFGRDASIFPGLVGGGAKVLIWLGSYASIPAQLRVFATSPTRSSSLPKGPKRNLTFFRIYSRIARANKNPRSFIEPYGAICIYKFSVWEESPRVSP